MYEADDELELLPQAAAEAVDLIPRPIPQLEPLQPPLGPLLRRFAVYALEPRQVNEHLHHLEVIVEPPLLGQVPDLLPATRRAPAPRRRQV